MTTMPPLKGPFGASIAAIGLTAVMAAAYAPSIVSSINAPTTIAVDPSAGLEEFLDRHHTWRERSEDRFLGRSIFFRPSPWPREPAPPRVVVQNDPPPRPDPKPPPGPPDNYMGPMPKAVIGDVVWFPDKTRIRVGEEADGITVIAVKSPWTVRLGRDGGEYDVDVMTRHDPFGDSNLASNTLEFEVQGSNQNDAVDPPREQTRTPSRGGDGANDRRDRAERARRGRDG